MTYPFGNYGNNELFSPNPSTPQETIRTAYNRAFVNWQAFWTEAYRDQSFYLNNQWTPEERRYLQQEQRPDYCYNLVRSAVNMIQGYERKHRLSLVSQAVESSSEHTATLNTKCLYHTMRDGQGHYAASDAFKGALVTGIGYIGLQMDYREDPLNGDLKYHFYPWNSIITDPFWTKKDFSDCDYLIRRAYMDKQDAISNFPDKKKLIMAMQGNMRDDLFTFLPQQRIFQSQNLLAYTEYWEQQWKTVEVVVNPFTLQEIEVNSKNSEFLRPLQRMEGIQSYKKQKRQMKWYGLLNNEVVAEDMNPYNLNEYPFVPVIAVYEPEYDLYQYKMQSAIRCIRDPQIEFNKRISKMTDAIDGQINSGWIIKKSRFDNFKDFYKTGNGRLIFGKENADLMNDARKIDPGVMPPGLFEMQQLMNQLTMRIIGVNEELLGAADDDKAGILSMLRQGAGLIGLQDLFDNFRFALEIVGDKSLKMIHSNWRPEKVMKVTGMQPTKEFYDRSFGKYKTICVQAPLTETQQQLYFQQLMSFKEMGAPIPWKSIFKAIPMQSKEELLRDVEQAEQQQNQMAQAQMQMEMQDKQVVNNLLVKESELKIAGALEKLEKAKEDRARTVLDYAEADLDRAKAFKEMQGVDMDNIHKFIDAILKIENAEYSLNQNRETKETSNA